MKILFEEFLGEVRPTGNKPRIVKIKANLVVRESTRGALQ